MAGSGLWPTVSKDISGTVVKLEGGGWTHKTAAELFLPCLKDTRRKETVVLNSFRDVFFL